MHAFKPVVRRKLYVEIAEQIYDSIAKGRFLPGDRLPSERNLAEMFGASRTSVREALAILEAVGVVVVELGQGTFVSRPVGLRTFGKHQMSPIDVMEARQLYEHSIVDLVISRASPKHFSRLEETIYEMQLVLDDEEHITEFYESGVEFHRVFVTLAGNDVIARVGHSLLDDNPMLRILNRSGIESRASRVAQIEEHQGIVIALRKGDVEGAKRAVWGHLQGLQAVMFPNDTSE